MPTLEYAAPPLTRDEKKALLKLQQKQRKHYGDDGIDEDGSSESEDDGQFAVAPVLACF